MKYRNLKNDHDLFSMIDYQEEMICSLKGINKLDIVIDWELLRRNLKTLLDYDVRDRSNGGRSPIDTVLMV